MIVTLYRKMVPEKIRDVVYKAFLGEALRFYRKWCQNRLHYLIRYSVIPPKTEAERTLKTLGLIGISPYPYKWKSEYERKKCTVEIDPDN
ncbi:MAG: hypothetical protein LUC45_02245 [Paraprevotella sp.]|nr:hypothetical protein [Paraprevotella sp.]